MGGGWLTWIWYGVSDYLRIVVFICVRRTLIVSYIDSVLAYTPMFTVCFSHSSVSLHVKVQPYGKNTTSQNEAIFFNVKFLYNIFHIIFLTYHKVPTKQ